MADSLRTVRQQDTDKMPVSGPFGRILPRLTPSLAMIGLEIPARQPSLIGPGVPLLGFGKSVQLNEYDDGQYDRPECCANSQCLGNGTPLVATARDIALKTK